MTDNDKRQGGRPFKSGGKKPFAQKKHGGGKPAFRDRKAAPPRKPDQGERIAKAMARAGACSRRDAEEWIEAGRVAVNGRTLTSPAFNVTASDRITVDGAPLAARDKTRLFLFHKPRGFVTTDHDPEGRETIFDYLRGRHPELPRLMTVGRLDINTEGLLLLTNDGGLARVLELPQTGWLRRYRVRAHGSTDQAALDTLAKGVTVEGVDYAPIEARLDRVQGANTWITIGLREGKNREVRRVLGSLGLEVNRLIRVSYGPFQLGELGEGAVEEVRTRVLREQLGPSLIAESQADFEASQPEREERAPRPRRDDRAERAPRPRRAGEGSERRGRDDRFARDEEPAKKIERPKPGSRKHVSTLRAERGERLKKDRVKIERAATEDRKGRAVVVERVVSAQPKEQPETRNARRFKAERDATVPRRGRGKQAPAERRDGERPMRRRPREDGGPAGEKRFERREGGGKFERGEARGERAFRPREGAAERPRGPRRDDRPGGERRSERPRGEGRFEKQGGERRFEKREGGERFARDESRGERPFRSRETAGDRPRAPRRDGEGAGKRFPRSEGGGKFGGDRKGPPRERAARPGGGDRPRGKPDRKGPPRGPRDKS